MSGDGYCTPEKSPSLQTDDPYPLGATFVINETCFIPEWHGLTGEIHAHLDPRDDHPDDDPLLLHGIVLDDQGNEQHLMLLPTDITVTAAPE